MCLETLSQVLSFGLTLPPPSCTLREYLRVFRNINHPLEWKTLMAGRIEPDRSASGLTPVSGTPERSRSFDGAKARTIFFVLLGVAALVLKRHYAGPLQELVHSYGGNIAVSFAVYFIVLRLPFHFGPKRLFTAGLGLAAVELFEALNGFGVMANVYDPADFVANGLGVVLALGIDTGLSRRSRTAGTPDSE